MNNYEAVDTALKEHGKFAFKTLEKEAKLLSEELEDDEELISLCASSKMMDDFKLLALTNSRFVYVLTSGIKKPKVINYSIAEEVFSSIRWDPKKIKFVFNGADEETVLHFPNNESNYLAAQIIANEADKNIEENLAAPASDLLEGKISKKVSLEFVNGHKEVGLKSKIAKLIQLESGEVYFKELGRNATSLYEFYNYDRTQNIRRTEYHALRNADWGRFLGGKQGANAMAIGSTAGKDLSTATLFLVNKETKEKYVVIAKCDSKKFSKLSEFKTSAQLDFGDSEGRDTGYDKYAEVERIYDLKEKGILSEEEFETEKAKLLK